MVWSLWSYVVKNNPFPINWRVVIFIYKLFLLFNACCCHLLIAITSTSPYYLGLSHAVIDLSFKGQNNDFRLHSSKPGNKFLWLQMCDTEATCRAKSALFLIAVTWWKYSVHSCSVGLQRISVSVLAAFYCTTLSVFVCSWRSPSGSHPSIH